MKNIKTTIAATVALTACVSTSSYAQLTKQDTITISMVGSKQSSVSTSPTVANAGNWSSGPMYYKTAAVKVTDKDVIQYIGAVLWGNANHYSAKAKLVLVQGELSGFFNLVVNSDGVSDLGIQLPNVDANGHPDGTFPGNGDSSTALQNSTDSTTFELANGRHWDVNPINPNRLPVGHLQPWGQIYVQDPIRGDDNVTYFFAVSVQECYDCFYLNSFVSTANFKWLKTSSTGSVSGPPCCSSPGTTNSVIVGTGKDAYYVTLSFDNSLNNPYLCPPADALAAGSASSCYVGDYVGTATITNNPTPVVGLGSTTIPGDGVVPDTILKGGTNYVDTIKSFVGSPLPYEARFTLNGVLTYNWNLALINKNTDVAPEFVGTGSYVANGYGFVGLYCTLFNTANVTFHEQIVKATATETGEPWSGWWYGIGAEYVDDQVNGIVTDYVNFLLNGNPYVWGTPVAYPTPINVGTSLSYHKGADTVYPSNLADFAPSASWPTPGYIHPLSHF